jgi:hypothetical protein
MYLLIRTHTTNEHADTPDYACVELTPFLTGLALGRIALVTQRKADGRDALYGMEYWDDHAEYRTWSERFADEEDRESLKTRHGEDAEELVDSGERAVVETLPPRPPPTDPFDDPGQGLDCHTMVVTNDDVYWTCLYETFSGTVVVETDHVSATWLLTLHQELTHEPPTVPEL